MAKTLSVIVNTWNGLPYVKSFVWAFLANTSDLENTELCIALDGCSDGSQEFLENIDTHNRIKFIWDKHHGVSHSINNAARLASNEYLVWCAIDYLLLPDWDDRLRKYLHPHNFVVIDLIEPFENSVFPPGAFFGNSPSELDYPALLKYYQSRAEIIDHRLDHVTSNGAFHRDRFTEVGGFDEAYDPVPLMDDDFFYSMHRNDSEMVFFCPRDVSFYHFIKGVLRRGDAQAQKNSNSEQIFQDKHGIPFQVLRQRIKENTLPVKETLESRDIILAGGIPVNMGPSGKEREEWLPIPVDAGKPIKRMLQFEREVYDAESYGERYSKELVDDSGGLDKYIREFVSEFEDKSSVLVVGAGHPLHCNSYWRKCNNISRLVALDIHPQAGAGLDEGIEFVCADLLKDDLPGVFDYLISTHTVEHFTRGEIMEIILPKCLRAARKAVIFVVPYSDVAWANDPEHKVQLDEHDELAAQAIRWKRLMNKGQELVLWFEGRADENSS